MKILLIFFSLLMFLPISWADNVDVTSNLPSGTYQTPIFIELTPTDSSAKTFYSFKPDGYPQDAFLYTGAILLKKSTPFVFFSVISTANESKIKLNDYIIQYPTSVHFSETEKIIGTEKTVQTSLINDSLTSIDIGYWQVRSEAALLEIPKGTMIRPGEKFDIRIEYAGSSSIILQSPDGEERGTLKITREIPKETVVFPVKSVRIAPKNPPVTKESQTTATKESPNVTETATIIAPETEASVSTASGTVASVPAPISEAIPPVANPIITKTPETDSSNNLADSLKISAGENQSRTSPLYIALALALFLALGAVQFFMMKRKKGNT